MNDMPQMATFVYDLYRKKVEAIAKDPNVSYFFTLFLSLDGSITHFSVEIFMICWPSFLLFFIIYLFCDKNL